MHQLMLVGWNDFKLIFRDSSLKVYLAMPALIFLVVFLLIPYLSQRFEGFQTFIPYILMAAGMQASVMFGFIYSMVLIHEKDIHVARVYGILPISKGMFIISRMVLPFLISCLVTVVIFQFQSFYSISIIDNILLSMLCGLLAPVLALLVTVLSKNKMEGLTWFKIINMFVMIPVAAFFVPSYEHLFGIFPTHWAFQSLSKIISMNSFVLVYIVGLLYSLVLIYLLMIRFRKVHFL
ncbi:MAG: hypothetical protein KJP00_06665 [Bacteroidia bacterium]|nr:hypothetical protein [Bacteroidia bacterium]